MAAIFFALLCSVLWQGQVRDQPARRDEPSPGAVSISGRVQAVGTGAPIQGAVIVLVTAPIMESHSSGRDAEAARIDGRSAMTDASGGFSFTGVAPGSYRLIVTPAFHQGRYLPTGHGASRPNDPGRIIMVRAGEHIRDLTLLLPTSVAIEGRITDESGEPLSRMPVIAARVMPGSDVAQRVGHEPATTDDLGRYRIYGLEPGEYVVAVEGRSVPVARAPQPGARVALSEQELMAFLTTFHPSTLVEASAQRIYLTPGRDAVGVDISAVRARRFRVSGVVLDSQGVPLASANGVLSRAAAMSATSQGFTSDAQGRFSLAAVEPGDYTLVVGGGSWTSPVGSAGRPENAEVPMTVASDVEDVVVITQPGVSLSGRVVLTEPSLTPPHPRIVFRRADGSIARSPDIVATVGDDLRIQAADLFGPRFVRVSGLSGDWAVKAVVLNGADITDVPTIFTKEHDGQLQVVLSSRLSAIEGEVRDETGKPAAEAMVYVFSEDRKSWSLASPRTVFSDVRPDGRFTVGKLTGGSYFAIAVAREGLRLPQFPREAFFELLSREATPFVIGDDERRTLALRLWRWPD